MTTFQDPDRIREFSLDLPRRLSLEGTATCAPWKEGASNEVWKLDIGSVPCVLKIGKLPHWRRLGIEAEILRRLDGRSAPRLLAQGSADAVFPWDWSVLERIEGIHPFVLDRADAVSLARSLAAIRLVEIEDGMQDTGWRRFLDDRICSRMDAARGIDSARRTLEEFERVVARIEAFSSRGDLLDGLPAGTIHGDLIPLNVLKKPDGSFAILDWENPRRGAACWDLAGIRKAFRLDEGAWDALLAGIGEPCPTEAVDFADALQNLQVAAWRLETWWIREIREGGDFFLVELGQELERAARLLR